MFHCDVFYFHIKDRIIASAVWLTGKSIDTLVKSVILCQYHYRDGYIQKCYLGY